MHKVKTRFTGCGLIAIRNERNRSQPKFRKDRCER